MRYSLRTLLIVMLLGGPLCAWGWIEWKTTRHRPATRKRATQEIAAPAPVFVGRPFPVICGMPLIAEWAEEEEKRKQKKEAADMIQPLEVYYFSPDDPLP